jgi:hypothetical protein
MKWIKQNEWNLVVAVAFLSFVCGIIGVNDALLISGKSAPWPDLVYFSIRLFFFNYDLPGEGIPYAPGTPLLQVARFLAPATITYAAVKGFMLAAATALNIWRTPSMDDSKILILVGSCSENIESTWAVLQRMESLT